MAQNIVTNKLIQLKDANGNLVYPKVLGESIPNGSVTKVQLDDEVKQKIDGFVITLNYSGRPGEYEVGESSLSSFSDLETYYNAYEQGINIYFVINSVGHGHGFNTSSTEYLPVYYFSYRSNSGYTLKVKDDLFIYTANSIDESPYLTVTTSAITTEPKDFSVTTDKILNRAVTKEKLSKDVLEDITSITWSELKTLRNNSELLPGHQYRITDYQCTTTQEDTQSTGHQFDIIVTADSTNKLNEKARACLHDGDTYFENSNLAAWQLWYCLDNDTNRFSWAGTHISIMLLNTPPSHINLPLTSTTVIDGVTYYYWNYTGYSYMTSKDPASLIVGDSIYYNTSEANTAPTSIYQNQSTITHIEKPTGVIYRMIDEWNNDCPYDFKNIQFKRYKITKSKSSSLIGTYLATEANSDMGLEIDNNDSRMFYTFSYLGVLNTLARQSMEILEDASIIGNTLQSDNRSPYGVHSNTIKYYFNPNIESSKPIQSLNNIVFLTYSEDDVYYGCYSNSFDVNCFNISFGDMCYDNSFGNECYGNSFGNECYGNSFGGMCMYNSFGNECYGNSFGNECQDNSFGINCRYITLGNYYRLNTFDHGVSYVTFDDDRAGYKPIQNYHIKQSIVFDAGSEYTINAKPGLNYVLSVAKKTDGTVVEYNEADTHKLVSITDQDYAALTTKDSNTVYCIPEQ